MKKIGFFLFFILWTIPYTYADEIITLLTYYPAPYGVYKQFRVTHDGTTNDFAVDASGNTSVGGTLTVTGLSSLNGGTSTTTLTATQAAQLQLGLTVSGGATNLQQGLTVTGGATNLQQGLTVTGGTGTDTLDASGAANLTGGLTVTGGTGTDTLTASGAANLNGGTTTTTLIAGGNNFQVDTNGNLTKINNAPYSWPGTSNTGSATYLRNTGTGNLEWASGTGAVNKIIGSPHISVLPSEGTGDVTITYTDGGGGGGGGGVTSVTAVDGVSADPTTGAVEISSNLRSGDGISVTTPGDGTAVITNSTYANRPGVAYNNYFIYDNNNHSPGWTTVGTLTINIPTDSGYVLVQASGQIYTYNNDWTLLYVGIAQTTNSAPSNGGQTSANSGPNNNNFAVPFAVSNVYTVTSRGNKTFYIVGDTSETQRLQVRGSIQAIYFPVSY